MEKGMRAKEGAQVEKGMRAKRGRTGGKRDVSHTEAHLSLAERVERGVEHAVGPGVALERVVKAKEPLGVAELRLLLVAQEGVLIDGDGVDTGPSGHLAAAQDEHPVLLRKVAAGWH